MTDNFAEHRHDHQNQQVSAPRHVLESHQPEHSMGSGSVVVAACGALIGVGRLQDGQGVGAGADHRTPGVGGFQLVGACTATKGEWRPSTEIASSRRWRNIGLDVHATGNAMSHNSSIGGVDFGSFR